MRPLKLCSSNHTAVRAQDDHPVLGLMGSKSKEPEIELIELERLKGRYENDLIEFLNDKTGRSPAALRKALRKDLEFEEAQCFRIACGNDEKLFQRIMPFAGLIREDTFGHPVVIQGGGLYVTAGTDRRESGTHYTPRALTEPIVQHALEPLVFFGPAEGKPKEEWTLRSARELLQLKICGMAMGSGAFLVQACRYLSERLVEAWEETIKVNPDVVRITPEGEASSGSPGESLIPTDPDERLAYARRLFCDRCLYGVDKNPMAVDMAKLSLWLITMDKGRAFTFLDHALKAGDSLLGLYDLEQIEQFHIATEHSDDKQLTMWWRNITRELLGQALQERNELESFVVNNVRDSQRKAALLAEADAAMNRVRIVCDLLVGSAISSADGESQRRNGAPSASFEKIRKEAWAELLKNYQRGEVFSAHEAIEALAIQASQLLNKGNPKGQTARQPFHWPIEFPEIFANGREKGFSAVLSNPPFQGGQKITGVRGTDYRNHLVDYLANGQKGSADLCAYFFLRAGQLLQPGGGFGMLATNTIAQGDTREVCLDQLQKADFTISRAVSSQKWPGTANLEVAQVWVRKGIWSGEYLLNGKQAKGITSFLSIPGRVHGVPYKLAANADRSFIGSYVLGMGFLLTPDEAQSVIGTNPRNGEAIFPYLNGEDLNSRPDQSSRRFVINFRDWPLDRSAEGSWAKAAERERKTWLQNGQVPTDYPAQVAADYPDLLAILENKVKPERTRTNPDGSFVIRTVRALRWWQYAEKCAELYRAIEPYERILIRARVSNINSIALVPSGSVFLDQTVVFALDQYRFFSLLQSVMHTEWLAHYASSMRTDTRYTTSVRFETFPFPKTIDYLDEIGQTYYLHRQSNIQSPQEGLTKTYNRFHTSNENAFDIARLRELHIELDYAVSAAYGWKDISLNHDFHETKQSERFTICEAARQEILDRLLALNHERYAEEVAAGLHDKGKNSKAKKSRMPPPESYRGKQLRIGI